MRLRAVLIGTRLPGPTGRGQGLGPQLPAGACTGPSSSLSIATIRAASTRIP